MNYVKKTRQFVCKMAMPFALMFAACSTEESHVNAQMGDVPVLPRGGAEEETGVYAFNNLTGRSMRVSYEASSDSMLVSSKLWDGYMVKMTELDSVTFDTTQNFYYSSFTDHSGMFSFDSVSLNSPYVLLEVSPMRNVNWWEPDEDLDWYYAYTGKPVPYRTVVDLRESEEISINVMSSLEAYRLLYLVKQGTSFNAAKLQADRDVMDAFGFYDAPFRYGKFVYFSSDADMDAVYFVSVFTESSDKCINQQSIDSFATKGSFVDISDSAKQDCKASMAPALWYGKNTSSDDKIMYGNFLSSLYGLGKCTEAKEGDSLELEFLGPDLTLKVKCTSGDWNASAFRTVQEEILRTEGSMTDERDGRTYKTVSYSFNGITQTWMAENLVYSSETVKPVLDSASVDDLLKEKAQNIRIGMVNQNVGSEEYLDWERVIADGCWYCTFDSSYWDTYVEYKWFEAMDLDSSLVPMDSVYVDYDKVVAIVDSIESEKGYYQGLCPDGWRLPKAEDWVELFKQVYRSQGAIVEEKNKNWVEGACYFPEIGFGPFSTEDFVVRPQDVGNLLKFGVQKTYDIEFYSNLKMNWNDVRYMRPDEMMSVRCIKNE